LQGFLLQVDVAEIVIEKADEPNALVDFLIPSFWPASTSRPCQLPPFATPPSRTGFLRRIVAVPRPS